jgi:hypothetical protein
MLHQIRHHLYRLAPPQRAAIVGEGAKHHLHRDALQRLPQTLRHLRNGSPPPPHQTHNDCHQHGQGQQPKRNSHPCFSYSSEDCEAGKSLICSLEEDLRTRASFAPALRAPYPSDSTSPPSCSSPSASPASTCRTAPLPASTFTSK